MVGDLILLTMVPSSAVRYGANSTALWKRFFRFIMRASISTP